MKPGAGKTLPSVKLLYHYDIKVKIIIIVLCFYLQSLGAKLCSFYLLLSVNDTTDCYRLKYHQGNKRQS